MSDRHDYDDLFRTAAPVLWRAIYAYSGGRRSIAEDAVQEAFARAIQHDGDIRSPVPWLYRTAFRIASSELKKASRNGDLAGEGVEDFPSDLHELIPALAKLSPNQRAAIYLFYQADLPVREVARLMGTSAAAVKVHLHRGRARLRDLLTENGDQQ